MTQSETELKNKIDSLLLCYREQINTSLIRSISYVQIDPLGRLQSNGNIVEFETKTGQINGLFFQADLIAKQFYDSHFPNLGPASLKTQEGLDLLSGSSLLRTSPIGTSLPLDHNALIIPAFAALNRVAIFVIDIKSDTSSNALDLTSVLLKAQKYHLDICRLQNEFNIAKVRLTPREKETLLCVVKGQSNSEIAKTLGLSLHTVTGYLRNIFLKMHTTDRTSAAISAVHKGLLHDLKLNGVRPQNQTLTAHELSVG